MSPEEISQLIPESTEWRIVWVIGSIVFLMLVLPSKNKGKSGAGKQNSAKADTDSRALAHRKRVEADEAVLKQINELVTAFVRRMAELGYPGLRKPLSRLHPVRMRKFGISSLPIDITISNQGCWWFWVDMEPVAIITPNGEWWYMGSYNGWRVASDQVRTAWEGINYWTTSSACQNRSLIGTGDDLPYEREETIHLAERGPTFVEFASTAKNTVALEWFQRLARQELTKYDPRHGGRSPTHRGQSTDRTGSVGTPQPPRPRKKGKRRDPS